MLNYPLLFSHYSLNTEFQLKNRIVMAPMTRNMADNDLAPTQDMVDYYARRSDAGLIITEGTIISPDATSSSNIPGIFTETQINGWRQVTEAVGVRGGRIFLQIWHVGRVTHPHFLKGNLPISPSETLMTGRVYRTEGLHYGKSRAATLDEIKRLITDYATAAKRAIKAGFDGVEIHGANGYLIDQFLHHHTNYRIDQYGETPENMARFAMEVVNACANEIGYHKIGIRLSPAAYFNEINGDLRDAHNFQYLLEELNQLPIAYVHTGNFEDKIKFAELNHKTMTEFMREHYKGTLIACGSYQFDEAEQGIATKKFDLIAIGRSFIANPDLIERLSKNKAICSYKPSMLNKLY